MLFKLVKSRSISTRGVIVAVHLIYHFYREDQRLPVRVIEPPVPCTVPGLQAN